MAPPHGKVGTVVSLLHQVEEVVRERDGLSDVLVALVVRLPGDNLIGHERESDQRRRVTPSRSCCTTSRLRL